MFRIEYLNNIEIIYPNYCNIELDIAYYIIPKEVLEWNWFLLLYAEL